jgi:hypothetical protein
MRKRKCVCGCGRPVTSDLPHAKFATRRCRGRWWDRLLRNFNWYRSLLATKARATWKPRTPEQLQRARELAAIRRRKKQKVNKGGSRQ